MPKVLIGCKLPNGLVVDGIAGEVHLNGANTSLVIGGSFGITSIDSDEAAYMFAKYAEHSAFKGMSVFTADSSSVDDIASLADDLQGVSTGLEGVNPEAPDKGLKMDDATNKSLQEAQANRRPAAPVATKADAKLAQELANKQ